MVLKAAVSDKSVPYIASLKNLRFVNLRNTYVTEDGLPKLKQALPECNIVDMP
jgi:hypothetical protein